MRNWITGKQIPLGVMLLFFALIPLWVGGYYLHVLQTVAIYAILGLGLNIFMGLCGQANFGCAGFFLLGAYTCGLLQVHLGLHYFAAIIPTLIICALVTLAMGKLFLRLRELSLALGTFAFSIVLSQLVECTLPMSFCGGANGLSVPPTLLFGHRLGTTFNYYYIVGWLVLVLLGCEALRLSRVGRAWQAIAGDEVAASTNGIDVNKYKSLAFVINGTLCGLAGCLLVQQTLWIAPGQFHLWLNAIILIVAVIGGLGSNWGMLMGALIIVVMGEVLMYVQSFATLIYGVIFFAVLRFMPEGVAGYMGRLTRRAALVAEKIRAGRG